MNDLRHLVGKHFLRVIHLLPFDGRQTMYFLHGEEGEQREAGRDIRIINVPPILVEIIGRCLLRVKPKRSARRFAHFLSIAFGQQFIG